MLKILNGEMGKFMQILTIFLISSFVAVLVFIFDKIKENFINENEITTKDREETPKNINLPFIKVAVEFLEIGYKMHNAGGAYNWSMMYLLPRYQNRKLVGFSVCVGTYNKPAYYDAKFMNNFLLKNNMAGNWKVSTDVNGDTCFMVDFGFYDTPCKWKDFSVSVWNQIIAKHPNWKITTHNDKTIKFVEIS